MLIHITVSRKTSNPKKHTSLGSLHCNGCRLPQATQAYVGGPVDTHVVCESALLQSIKPPDMNVMMYVITLRTDHYCRYVIYLFIYPSIHSSIDPSIHLSIHPTIHPSIHLSTYYLSILSYLNLISSHLI